jgi:GntR family transcriptional regulator, rspAB operon transcriptional repressor
MICSYYSRPFLWSFQVIKPKQKVADKAYTALREMIIHLDLEPGSLLDDRILTKKLGVGRTPLREAIHRLAAEKLVVIVPRRGAFVMEIRDGDAWQLYEARLQTERMAARLAAERITSDQLDRLESLFANLPDSQRFLDDREIDWQFHRGIAEATQNRYLLDIIERLYSLAMRLRFLRYAYEGMEVRADYQLVLDALRDRDPERAEAAMVTHVSRLKTHMKLPGA